MGSNKSGVRKTSGEIYSMEKETGARIAHGRRTVIVIYKQTELRLPPQHR